MAHIPSVKMEEAGFLTFRHQGKKDFLVSLLNSIFTYNLRSHQKNKRMVERV